MYSESQCSDTYEQVRVESLVEWRRWLGANHGSSPGIWLVTPKATGGRPGIAWSDLVDEALCFGWVDSRPRRVDEHHSARLLTPRRPASAWSARNKARVEALTEAGRMQPAGLEAVAVAKERGTWHALDQVETLDEPADLAAALDAVSDARRYWDAFPRSTKRAILEWIAQAKTDATRQRRVERTVADAARNLRANQWRQPKGGGPPPG